MPSQNHEVKSAATALGKYSWNADAAKLEEKMAKKEVYG